MTLTIAELEDLAEEALRNETEAEAEVVLKTWLETQGPQAQILHWRALLLRALDRRAEALALLDQAGTLDPASPSIARSRAQVALEAGLPAAALAESALQLAPTSSEARLGLISAYYAEGRGAMALELLAGALAGNPGWQDGYRQHAQLSALLGQSVQGLLPLTRTIERFPDALEMQLQALDMLMAKGDYAAAAQLAEQALRRFGEHRPLLIDRATVLDELGQADQAAVVFGQCGEPGDAAHACRLIRHLLRRGNPGEALRTAEPWLASNAATQIWPYVALAWRTLGDRQADWLERQQGLVQVYDLAEQTSDLTGLAERLRLIHARSGQFADQSVKGGTQTDGPLFARIEPEIVAIRQLIVDSLAKHLAGLPTQDPFHPQLAPRRDRPVRFAGSWSVRLEGQGFHRVHHHPQGWFSAVFYVAVPDSLEQREGQLVLGGSPQELGLDLEPFQYVEPRAGRLVIFPSTLWHATEPFRSGERMTISFDLARPFEES